MKHKQKTAIVAGKPAMKAGETATSASGFRYPPDVPLHPLDGPIPTD